jgi:hypothetical protein
VVGLYGSNLAPQQLPKLQQTLLILKDQLASQEIIKAYQMTLKNLKYLMKISETDNCPDIYLIFKEAASLVISSDKAKAAKFCEEIQLDS